MKAVRVLVAMVPALILAAPVLAATLKCAADAVKVGTVCVDKYEASVWQIDPIANKALVKKVEKGKATLADLTAGGAVQLGCTAAPFSHAAYPANFPSNGNWTPVLGSDPPSPGVYAVSILGVLPTTCTNWFRAEHACALSGKRLLTNQEWQRAAAGTPDPGAADDGTTCATNSAGPANTGSRGCSSSWGAWDMVGNVLEWVADWQPLANGCEHWNILPGFTDGDVSCLGNDVSSADQRLPGALLRGGYWGDGTEAGVYAVRGQTIPVNSGIATGFRCAR